MIHDGKKRRAFAVGRKRFIDLEIAAGRRVEHDELRLFDQFERFDEGDQVNLRFPDVIEEGIGCSKNRCAVSDIPGVQRGHSKGCAQIGSASFGVEVPIGQC